MKKIFQGAVFILFTIFLSGCLQVETNVYVNKDGSGTIEETVLFKDEVIDMMKQFIMAFDTTQTEEFNLIKEEELISKASKYGEGVSYVSSEKLKSNGFEGAKVVYAFNDITKLNLSLISDDAVPSLGEDESTPTENEQIKFVLDKSSLQTKLKIILPSMKMDSEDETLNQEVNESTFNDEFEKAKEMFTDMKMLLRIIPTDKIIQTDADFFQDNKVTLMEMNMNSLLYKPELFKELSGNKVKSLDEFRELIKNVEGFKVESKNEILVTF